MFDVSGNKMGKKKGKGPGPAPPRSNPVSESEGGNSSPSTPVTNPVATSVVPAPTIPAPPPAPTVPVESPKPVEPTIPKSESIIVGDISPNPTQKQETSAVVPTVAAAISKPQQQATKIEIIETSKVEPGTQTKDVPASVEKLGQNTILMQIEAVTQKTDVPAKVEIVPTKIELPTTTTTPCLLTQKTLEEVPKNDNLAQKADGVPQAKEASHQNKSVAAQVKDVPLPNIDGKSPIFEPVLSKLENQTQKTENILQKIENPSQPIAIEARQNDPLPKKIETSTPEIACSKLEPETQKKEITVLKPEPLPQKPETVVSKEVTATQRIETYTEAVQKIVTPTSPPKKEPVPKTESLKPVEIQPPKAVETCQKVETPVEQTKPTTDFSAASPDFSLAQKNLSHPKTEMTDTINTLQTVALKGDTAGNVNITKEVTLPDVAQPAMACTQIDTESEKIPEMTKKETGSKGKSNQKPEIPRKPPNLMQAKPTKQTQQPPKSVDNKEKDTIVTTQIFESTVLKQENLIPKSSGDTKVPEAVKCEKPEQPKAKSEIFIADKAESDNKLVQSPLNITPTSVADKEKSKADDKKLEPPTKDKSQSKPPIKTEKTIHESPDASKRTDSLTEKQSSESTISSKPADNVPKDTSKSKEDAKKTNEVKDNKKPAAKLQTEKTAVSTPSNEKQDTEQKKGKQNTASTKDSKVKEVQGDKKVEAKSAQDKTNEDKGKAQKQPQTQPKDSAKVKEKDAVDKTQPEKSMSEALKSQKTTTAEKDGKTKPAKLPSDNKSETKPQTEKGKGQPKKNEPKSQSEKAKDEKEKPQKQIPVPKDGKPKDEKMSKKSDNSAGQKGKEDKIHNLAEVNKEKTENELKLDSKTSATELSSGDNVSEKTPNVPVDSESAAAAAKKKRRRKKKKPTEGGNKVDTQSDGKHIGANEVKPTADNKPLQLNATQGTKSQEKPKQETVKATAETVEAKNPGAISSGKGETEVTQAKKKKNKKKKKQGASGSETVTGTSNAGNETAGQKKTPTKPLNSKLIIVNRLAHHLSNCCCICKSTGIENSPVLTCSACSLACYCGREHQVKHWPEHKEFCYYISSLLSKERPYFFSPAEKMNQDERRHFKLSELQLCQKALNRTLTPLESALILHPRACFSCYKPVFQNVCKGCYCINYCCSEHLPNDHQNWCDTFRIKLLFVQSQNEHGSAGITVPRPSRICYPLNSDMKEYLQSLNFVSPNNMSPDLYIAHISELATYPLTLLHALQLLATQGATNPLQYEHLVVHVVGAEDVYECCQMLKWKYFFVNLLPKLKTLHLVFIGCELSIDDEKVHVEGRLVYEFHAKMTYLDYCKKCYIKPSIVCAFNSGLYRNTGFKGLDSWGPSLIPMLNMNPGAPLLLTAYTHMESQLDVQRLKEIFLNNLQVVQQPLKNPYASIFPNHNLVSEHECPVAFRNYYLAIVRHT
jgi:splicing suppressor protein 51